MNDPESEFCRSLQLEWSVVEAKYARGIASVRLEHGSQVPYPESLGRPVREVMSQPSVFNIKQSAELTFEQVVWFQLVDEFTHSTAINAEAGQFIGRYFQYSAESTLLTRLRGSRTDEEGNRLKHYRLITGDDVLDIVSPIAPTVALHR